MTLDGFEAAVKAAAAKRTGTRGHKLNIIRYADDRVITGNTRALLEENIRPAIVSFLAQRGLELSEEKTRVVHIEDGFDFLGKNLRKYGSKLLIKPARKGVKALLDKVRHIISKNKQAVQINLIHQLNPIIRGWAMYHRHGVSKDTFNRIDSVIWECLWQWAKRRHPNKTARWIAARYFHRIGERQSAFADGCCIGDRFIGVQLFSASSLSIKRHTKIICEATAFDPQWVAYLNKRKTKGSVMELPGLIRGC